tara:strand:- start:167 stop:328 length:162 start_codon:yes stop_codon:yes gene_type:complete
VKELYKLFNDKYTIKPEDKALIIFPSWLQLWVTTNLEEEDRILIAFNFRYQNK